MNTETKVTLSSFAVVTGMFIVFILFLCEMSVIGVKYVERHAVLQQRPYTPHLSANEFYDSIGMRYYWQRPMNQDSVSYYRFNGLMLGGQNK